MSILRFLLFPLAFLYDVITRLRNHLYNTGYKSSVEFDRVVICVGNLNVGGSGKTPMIEYLIRLFSPKYKVATLSRGYGRKTTGFRLASNEDSAKTIGDEPFQFYLKYGDKVTVSVGEDRALAIPEMLSHHEELDIILLDDAFQHRPVKPGYSIVLTEYSNPFYKDFILPMGTLREARAGVRRADVVVITKCPSSISEEEKSLIRTSVKKYANNIPVFFSGIKYGNPQPINGHDWREDNKVIIVTGIAHSDVFESYLRSVFSVVHHFDFADHHAYTLDDIKKVEEKVSELGTGITVVTTEKDMVKLLPLKEAMSSPWHYIPIETIFIENGPEFDRSLLQTIKS